MPLLMRAKVLWILLSVSAAINVFLFLSPIGNRDDASLHLILAIYAAVGAAVFLIVSNVGTKDVQLGEKYFTGAIFIYIGAPVIFGYLMMFVL
jgi:hypothetical protein